MYYGMSGDGLEAMYVKGSLQNRGEGFVFQVKNLLDSGDVSGISKLVIDGEERPLDGVTIEMGGTVRPVSEIMWSASLYVHYGATLTVYVPGELTTGEHTLAFTLKVPEMGMLRLPITDSVA